MKIKKLGSIDFKIDRNTLFFTIICTFVIGFIVHGYCYSNVMFSHDSLGGLSMPGGSVKGEISIGRFLQPLDILYIRGHLAVPWIMGFFSLCWLSLANFFVIKTFDLNSKINTVILCAMTTTNMTLTYTNATYIHESSSLMLALLFAAISVYVFEKYRFGFIFTPIFIVLSCGFYQAYFSVSVILMMCVIAVPIMNNSSFKLILEKALKGICSLIVGLLLYYLVYEITFVISGASASSSYNSVEKIFDFNFANIINLIYSTYEKIIRAFIFPRTYYTLCALFVNFFIILISIIGVVKIYLKLSKINFVLLMVLILLLPLGANITYFLSQGVFHELMDFSYVYLYLFSFLILKYSGLINCKLIPRLIAVMLSFIVLSNYIYTNNIYFEKELTYYNTMSIMTRVIVDLEDTEGYVYGETPIIFVGQLSTSKMAIERPGFEHISGIGLGNSSITSPFRTQNYLNNVLPYNIVSGNLDEMENKDELDLESMPQYPNDGYIRMIDNQIIVKFS